MPELTDPNRRHFLRTAGVGVAGLAATGLVTADPGKAETPPQPNRPAPPREAATMGPIRQARTEALNIGYAEMGPENGPAALLLHGWPYDIHSYADVAPKLASAGHRVIVPYLRGFGTTRFLSDQAVRNGQQSVIAVDIVALMDALGVAKAVIGGCDWGARTACIIAALCRSAVRPWFR
jgi:hypothetical protein